VKPTVLLVDDSKFLRLSHERLLGRAGYRVVTAGDGEEALRLARESQPDIILLDMLLPKVQGLDVLRILKENQATRHIPVVVLSSLSRANEGKLVEAGAAAYFEKSRLEDDEQRLLSMLSKLTEHFVPN